VKCAVEIVKIKVSLGRRTQERNNNNERFANEKKKQRKELRDENSKVEIVICEPKNSSLVDSELHNN
jgi:hypothetical protein